MNIKAIVGATFLTGGLAGYILGNHLAGRKYEVELAALRADRASGVEAVSAPLAAVPESPPAASSSSITDSPVTLADADGTFGAEATSTPLAAVPESPPAASSSSITDSPVTLADADGTFGAEADFDTESPLGPASSLLLIEDGLDADSGVEVAFGPPGTESIVENTERTERNAPVRNPEWTMRPGPDGDGRPQTVLAGRGAQAVLEKLSVKGGVEANNNGDKRVAGAFTVGADFRLLRYLALGVKTGMSSTFGTANTVEASGTARFILPLRKPPEGVGVELFVQGEAGLSQVFMYEETRGLFMYGGAAGARLAFGKWYIEPAVRGGKPFLWGASVNVGYLFGEE